MSLFLFIRRCGVNAHFKRPLRVLESVLDSSHHCLADLGLIVPLRHRQLIALALTLDTAEPKILSPHFLRKFLSVRVHAKSIAFRSSRGLDDNAFSVMFLLNA